MSIPIQILKPDGRITVPSLSAGSLEELGCIEPLGVYTLTRTFNTDHVIMMDAHLDRLEESARLDGFLLEIDRPSLRNGLREMVSSSGFQDSRIRISVQRETPSDILLAIEPLQDVPQELRENGVIVSSSDVVRPNPRIKSTLWVNLRAKARNDLPPQSYEGIILGDESQILEGFSSNIYGVIDGSLRTSDQHVLRGIARLIILNVAADILPIHREAIQSEEIPDLEEAFLSSSGRGVVPIVQFDDIVIGDGNPGPYTREIIARYNAWVEANLEPL